MSFGYSHATAYLLVFYFGSNENNQFALKNGDYTNTMNSCNKSVLSKFWKELVISVIRKTSIEMRSISHYPNIS